MGPLDIPVQQGQLVCARPLDYVDLLVLHRAHVPCMCTHVAHAQHDVTRVCV